MIKQIWRIRNAHKLVIALCISLSTFMLVYSFLNVAVFDPQVLIKTFFWSENRVLGCKYLLLIQPVIWLICSCFLWYLSNIPKKLRYPITEETRKTALLDLKSHREYVIGCNLLLTIAAFFLQLDALNSTKSLPGFGFVPSAIALVLLALFSVRKLLATRKIYRI